MRCCRRRRHCVAAEAMALLYVGGGDVICLFFDAWLGNDLYSLAFGYAAMLCLVACSVRSVMDGSGGVLLFGALVSVRTDLDSTRFKSRRP